MGATPQYYVYAVSILNVSFMKTAAKSSQVYSFALLVIVMIVL